LASRPPVASSAASPAAELDPKMRLLHVRV
jgi:hypothetical protein